MKRMFLVFLAIVLFSTLFSQQIIVIPAGSVSGTWSGNAIYSITGNIYVPIGLSLTIEDGAKLEFCNNSKIDVYGQLMVRGSSTRNVIITSGSNSTYWSGINFHGTEDCFIDYANISRVKDTSAISIRSQCQKIKISNCFIHDNLIITPNLELILPGTYPQYKLGQGIQVLGGSQSLSISNNRFEDNISYNFETVPNISRVSIVLLLNCKDLIFDSNTIEKNTSGMMIESHFDEIIPNLAINRYQTFSDNIIKNNKVKCRTFYLSNSFSDKMSVQISSNNISFNSLFPANHAQNPGLVILGQSIVVNGNTISNNTYDSNSVFSVYGGGIEAVISGNIDIVNNYIYNNKASWGGGGIDIYISRSQEDIERIRSYCILSNEVSDLIELIHDTSQNRGGNRTINPRCSVVDNYIFRNSANKGGGIYLCNALNPYLIDNGDYSDGTSFVKNAIFENIADLGPAFYLDFSELALINNIVIQNRNRVVASDNHAILRTSPSTRSFIRNTIFWDNIGYNIFTPPPWNSSANDIDIAYSTLQGLRTSINSTVSYYDTSSINNTVPQFADTYGYDWHLLNTTYPNGSGYPFDNYIGLYPYDSNYFSTLERDLTAGNTYNWISYPKLLRDPNTDTGDPFSYIAGNLGSNGLEYKTTYDQVNLAIATYIPPWSGSLLPFRSTQGYKLKMSSAMTEVTYGKTIKPNTQIDLFARGSLGNWVGYFIPVTAYIREIIPPSLVPYITEIQTKHGSLYPVSSNPVEFLESSVPKTIEYGDMIIIHVNQDRTFQWVNGTRTSRSVKVMAQSFEVQEKADYKSLFVELDIDNPPYEIGALVDGEVKGATKYEGKISEILLYLDEEDLDKEIEIVFASNTRAPKQSISDYAMVNPQTKQLDYRPLVARGSDSYYHVKISDKEETSGKMTKPFSQLHQNYPNPFNPSTTISFYLSQDDNIHLSVYNIKGQKVKDLYSGNIESGRHTVVWNGNDNDNRQVSSGVYFYRINTTQGSETKKMLLIK